MQLEDYFDFNTTPVEHIRIKGTRINLDHVVELYKLGTKPEQIVAEHPTLELVQVYAAITYYLQNTKEVEAYLERGEQEWKGTEAAIRAQPESEAVKRIKAIKAAQALAAKAEQP
jgi:uncharacterized protein (DUF433 family)